MQTVIETKALCKQYGPHTAVDHVELHVPQGCVYGFIGPNGAGVVELTPHTKTLEEIFLSLTSEEAD